MSYQNADHLVETDWLEAHLADPELRILDCHVGMSPTLTGGIDFVPGRAEWEKGHIPGADFIDFSTELSDPASTMGFMLPPAEQFAEVMGRHGVGEGTRVVIYDELMNMWAARLWWMLRHYGFTNAAVLNGGSHKWKQEGRPLSQDVVAHAPAQFTPVRDGAPLFVGKDDVLAGITDAGTCLVDAMTSESYDGSPFPGVARPGHIASASNVPFAEVVDQNTMAYLPADQLQAKLAATSAGPDGRVITYCGAGIAASSVAFAMALVGRDNLSIYDASLFEWAADPALPMET
jgi:thiosulfate/3-mercaptopyruvate sulfurtransferase